MLGNGYGSRTAVICGLVLAVFFFGAGCERQVPVPTIETVRTQDGPDQETWEPELFLSEEGRPRLHLRAPYMAYFDRADSTHMVLSSLNDTTRVHAYIFDSQGDSSATVLADRILFYDRERRMVARGNVIVTAREGRRIESEHLEWSEFQKTIHTPGFARITMPDRDLQGYGLNADEELSNVRLSNVTGIVLIDDR
jgi:LPS export ABC transporter protein LptC